MLAVAGAPPADPRGWATELKWDGVRVIALLGPDGVRLYSRNDREVTVAYPELVAVPAGMSGRSAVLDGEVVSLDAAGRPSFARLQERMHVGDPVAARRLSRSAPVVYLVFDLLQLDGQDLTGLGYRQRRDRLEGLDLGPAWPVPPSFPDDPATILAASAEQGLEGVVCKRLASPYRPGRRSPDWVKVKHVRTQEVVVVGWRPGQGSRDGGIGSLLTGVHDTGGLRYAGRVGTGFSQQALAALRARLEPLRRPDPPLDVPLADRSIVRDAVWVQPVVVGEVAFGEWTTDGRLRHPVWRGLRPDKSAADVRVEP